MIAHLWAGGGGRQGREGALTFRTKADVWLERNNAPYTAAWAERNRSDSVLSSYTPSA